MCEDWPVGEDEAMSSETASPNETKLWAIVCPSVGEFFAIESLGEACYQAACCNAAMASHPRGEFSPPLFALMTIVVEWEGSAEEHAENIAEWKKEGGIE